MDRDDQRALAARKKVKRAASLAREASRELAQAFDCDVVAAAHVRRAADIPRTAAMIELAFSRSAGPIDVTVTAPAGSVRTEPHPTARRAQETPCVPST